MPRETIENKDYENNFSTLIDHFTEVKQSYVESGETVEDIGIRNHRKLAELIDYIAVHISSDDLEQLLPGEFNDAEQDQKIEVLTDLVLFLRSRAGADYNETTKIAINKASFKERSDQTLRENNEEPDDEGEMLENLMNISPELVLKYCDAEVNNDALKVIAVCLTTSDLWQLNGSQISEICSFFPLKKDGESINHYISECRARAENFALSGLSPDETMILIDEVLDFLMIKYRLRRRLETKGKKLPKRNWRYDMATTLNAIDVKAHINRCADEDEIAEVIAEDLNDEELVHQNIPNKVTHLESMVDIVDNNPQIEAVSFDLMDTLVFWKAHTVDKREEYFKKAVKIMALHGLNLTVDEFKNLRGYTTKDRKRVEGIWRAKRNEARMTGKEFSFVNIMRIIVDAACEMKNQSLDEGVKDKMCEEIQDAYVGVELETITLVPGAKETLEALKKRGVKIALLSNAVEDTESIKKYLRRVGLDQYFNAVKVSSTVGYQKNVRTTRFYDSLAEDLNIPTNKIAHVGDNLKADYIGARKAGVQGVHFEKDQETRKYIRRSKIPSTRYLSEKKETYANDLKEQRLAQIDKQMEKNGIPEEERTELKELAARAYEVSRDLYAPAMMGFAAELLRDLKDDPEQINMCLGRDSIVFFILQQMLRRYNKDEFGDISARRIQYLPVSRKLVGGEDSKTTLWRETMALQNPEVITYDEDRLKTHIESRNFNDYRHVCLIDHGISGSTQNKIQALYPKKDIKGKYLISRIVNPKEKKSGYLVGYEKGRERGRTYSGKNAAKFGDKYKIMRRANSIRIMEDLFSGVFTSAEYFTQESRFVHGKKFELTSDRKLGETMGEKKRKILKLFALYAMHDAVRIYGDDVLNSSQQEEEKRIDTLVTWIKKITSRGNVHAWIDRNGMLTDKALEDAKTDVDARLLKVLYRYQPENDSTAS